jgi:hypothetical protein
MKTIYFETEDLGKHKKTFCLTRCEEKDCQVGSMKCQECPYLVAFDSDNEIVRCSKGNENQS